MEDWRLQGQEEYLQNAILERKRYRRYSQSWDHDHCEFCWEKFSLEIPGALQVGYATTDNDRWICDACFEDFKSRFNWTVNPGCHDVPERLELTSVQAMQAEETSSRVVLILEADFGEKILSSAITGAVWVVDSEKNRLYVEKARRLDASRSITTFPVREGESLASACDRIIWALDEHHNEQSRTPGYRELEVIGVSLPDVFEPIFRDLNFTRFVATKTGFLATKE
ncbi:MAG: hypothetical protein LBM17_03195 [Candidatus Accumulibacter sp.]|jgi:hypothetical protein|nr:hypothetical protein [Accumulibacter sp.]